MEPTGGFGRRTTSLLEAVRPLMDLVQFAAETAVSMTVDQHVVKRGWVRDGAVIPAGIPR